MTAQAKNRVLAYIVLGMLVVAALVGNHNTPVQHHNSPVAVLIPTDKPVLVAVEPSIDPAEFECLRTNIYFEAGNQSHHGKEAAALVVLTRMKTKHFPSTACGVVKVKARTKKGRWSCAFSWYCDNKPDEPNLKNPIERKAWDDSTEVATAALQGKIKDFLGGATHYHGDYVHPGWANSSRIRLITQIGTHIFYRDTKLKLKSA